METQKADFSLREIGFLSIKKIGGIRGEAIVWVCEMLSPSSLWDFPPIMFQP